MTNNTTHTVLNSFSKVLFFCAILFSTLAVSAQRDEARKHISTLHESVLLVRLQDRAKLISSLKERGLEAQIPTIVRERDAENLDIVNSFTERFTFCTVYFFYASESQKVLDKQFDVIGFVGPDLEVDKTIRPSISDFYVAEFAELQQDTRDKVKNTSRNDDRRHSSTEPKYVGGTEIGGHALIILDSSFEPVRAPFPFYTKTMKGLPFNRKYIKVVAIMNRKLTEFHNWR